MSFRAASRSIRLAAAFVLMAAFVFSATPAAFAFNYNNIPAAVVVGQPNFTSSDINYGGAEGNNNFQQPVGMLVVNGRLLVADSANQRVLIWNSLPTTNGAPADIVLGQPDFTTNVSLLATAYTMNRPSALATDGTKLFILDRDNYRVLIYNTIPTASNTPADVVIGWDDMNRHVYVPPAQNRLSSGPTGMAYDASTGKLIVYDSDWIRVLVWNQVPTTNGAPADVVIGQPDFETMDINNNTGTPSATGLNLSTASGVSTYNGKLFITDRQNHRILIYNTIPTTNHAPADVVIGQENFTSMVSGTAANLFNRTRGAVADSQGRLFTTEQLNARILIFNQIPTTNGASADLVIGQPNFTSSAGSVTAKTIMTGAWNVLPYEDKLLVSDSSSNRVLIFSLLAPTFGTVTASSIQVNQSSIIAQADENEYDWRVRRNNNTHLESHPISQASVTDTGLTENTQYTYEFQLNKSANFTGDYGPSASTYTLVAPPTNLHASSATESGVTVSVDTFTNDTVGSSGYYFSRGGANSGWIQANSWADSTGLNCDESRSYTVKYRNAAGVETDPVSVTITGECSGSGGSVPGTQEPITPTPSTPTPTNPTMPSTAPVLSVDGFVAAGTENTKILGAGERRGVIESFKTAHGRLPQSEADWSDIIKIAAGRWPAQRNIAAEERAVGSFGTIYGRKPVMTHANDNAAVTIMAYGLRPSFRRLSSEAAAIRTYRAIFGTTPATTAAWDMVRAIAYSGATR